MRLFGFLRRKPKVEEYVGRHRPGSWGEVALPPPLNTQPVARAVAPADQAITTAPQQVLPQPLKDASIAESAAKVRIGFADGTSMEFSDDSGEAAAFRQVAARLIDDSR